MGSQSGVHHESVGILLRAGCYGGRRNAPGRGFSARAAWLGAVDSWHRTDRGALARDADAGNTRQAFSAVASSNTDRQERAGCGAAFRVECRDVIIEA